MVRDPLWLVQQLIPPLLLTYFYFAWRICTFEVAPELLVQHQPLLAGIYPVLPTLLIGSITLLYLRLYFLPANQCVPPFDPPASIRQKRIIFQCFSPAQAAAIRAANDASATTNPPELGTGSAAYGNEPMVERCYKGKCAGRWKPARARHCSQCARCRGGFDHHCPFFANCLTAAYMPTFLALLVYTPPATFLLALPLYGPIFARARQAYAVSRADASIRDYWWDWGWSWVVAGGPVGRYAGGVILGWRQLDRIDGGGISRLGVGLVLFFSIVLILITLGLAHGTLAVLLNGHLTIDRGRSSAHAQALMAIHSLRKKGLPVPPALEEKVVKFSDKRHFFVPLPESQTSLGGVIVETLDQDRPYDHGWRRNLEIVVGPGWGWLLPWRALRRGMREEIFVWPLVPEVEKRLRSEAARRSAPE
ncbi:hypothetical protein IAU60_004831 [Kwoniella sp. DSM 27419]